MLLDSEPAARYTGVRGRVLLPKEGRHGRD